MWLKTHLLSWLIIDSHPLSLPWEYWGSHIHQQGVKGIIIYWGFLLESIWLPSICFLNETHLMYAIYMIFIKGCNSCVVSRNINGIPSTSRFGDIHLMSIVIQHKGKILILVCKGCYSCVDRVNINGIPIGSIFRDIHLISTKNYTRWN